MAVQRALVIVKPDGVKRGLVGEIISRFERKGFKIVALKMLTLTKAKAEELYSVHKGKPFFESLTRFMSSGPIVAFVIEGESAIEVARLMIGATDGRKAAPGTIRGDYALSVQENVVHVSDSEESFKRECKVIFGDEVPL